MADNDGWKAQLPEDQRENPSFTGFEKIGDFAEGYLFYEGATQELQGKLDNSIPKLSDQATEEEVSAYQKAIGRPETADGYEFQKPDLPEGVEYSPELEAGFRAEMFKLGLSKSQAEGLYGAYMTAWAGGLKAELEARGTKLEAATTALKTEWGADYDSNVVLMKRAVEKFGGEEFKKYMDDSGLGSDPMIVKTFTSIGKAMSEDTLTLGDPGAGEQKLGVDGKPMLEYPNSPGMAQ